MAKALIIKSDGKKSVIDFDPSAAYQTLSEVVGGLIERVSLPSHNLQMWLNEEGKLKGLQVNSVATDLWTLNYGVTDVVVGDVIITGNEDDEGEISGIYIDTLEKLLK